MKKEKLIVTLLFLALNFSYISAVEIVTFDDNQTHNIDYPINDFVSVEGTNTVVNWLTGASTTGLEVYGTSRIFVSGGSTGYDLEAYEYGNVTLESGLVGDELGAYGHSQIIFKGGQVNTNLLVDSFGTLTIYGTNFFVDGVSIGYGELSTLLGGGFYNEPKRHISGILSTGQTLDNDFYIGGNGQIVLIHEPIPEPCTLSLLALGAFFAGRRRKP